MLLSVPDDCQEIGLHELENQVEVFLVVRTQHLVQFYYVAVAYLLQDLHLAVRPLGVDVVPESPEDLLQGISSMRDSVLHLPNMAVRPTAQQLPDLVFRGDVAVDLFRHLNTIHSIYHPCLPYLFLQLSSTKPYRYTAFLPAFFLPCQPL